MPGNGRETVKSAGSGNVKMARWPMHGRDKYGKVAGEEQEVTIRLDQVGRQAHICSTWPAWSRKLEKRYGSPTRVITREGWVISAFWTVPVKAISLRSLGQKPAAARGE